MSDNLKLKYKVGEIEFEAEGTPDVVEQQRVNFMTAVLPAAVEAMVRTRTHVEAQQYIEAQDQTPMLVSGDDENAQPIMVESDNDLARTSLPSFLKTYGTLTEQEFTLFAAYFDEKKNGVRCFSIEDVKKYYTEARRPLPKNPSVSLNRLAGKGLIMDVEAPDDAKSGKCYMLSQEGMVYVEKYTPKEENLDNKKVHAKVKRTTNKRTSAYSGITADDLNLTSYPAVKSLSGAKEKVIMTMYIVTAENKGEWFTVDDIIHLLVNIFEIPADADFVNGVFRRNKSMFLSEQDPDNLKAYRRKLLSGAKDFAKGLIESSSVV